MKPQRIQRSRKAGFDLQIISLETNGLPAVYVGRPGKWGNPVGGAGLMPYPLVDIYQKWLNGEPEEVLFYGQPPTRQEIQAALRGKNLACWCPLDQPCHADVLLEIANSNG